MALLNVYPGLFLQEWMEEYKKSIPFVSQELQLTEPVVRGILYGTTSIDKDIASHLETLTSIPADAWLGYQADYEPNPRHYINDTLNWYHIDNEELREATRQFVAPLPPRQFFISYVDDDQQTLLLSWSLNDLSVEVELSNEGAYYLWAHDISSDKTYIIEDATKASAIHQQALKLLADEE